MSEGKLSLRDARKDARRARIAATARTVFQERGFSAATTAEIAKRAGVGVGTLFRYAADKNELLLLVLNEDLTRITEESIAGIDRRAPVVAQLVAFYRRRFAYWSSDVELAQAATAYIYVGPADKPERRRAQAREARQLEAIVGILTPSIAPRDAEIGALIVQYIYRGELRRWLRRPDPELADAMTRLHEQFAVVVAGLARADKSDYSPICRDRR